MKKIYLFIYLFIYAVLICACTKESQIDELKSSYIDYSAYPMEKYTLTDHLLVKSIRFQNGELTPLIDINSAISQGVSKEKYDYFLEYINIENKRIKGYLDEGAIVFYNGVPFTKNQKNAKYIDSTLPTKAEVGYTEVHQVWKEEYVGPSFSRYCTFTGPSKISVSMRGPGTIHMVDYSKCLSTYLVSVGLISEATFKWGFGNNILWDWEVT